MQESIEHPPDSGISIREVSNLTTINGERKSFGSSWLITIPAKRTNGKGRVRKQEDSLEAAKLWAEKNHKALKGGNGYLELGEKDRSQAASAFYMAKEAGIDSLTRLVSD